jgi:type III pantothenate kinase
MLLAIDIGNTNITLGVWDGKGWKHAWRLATAPEKTVDEYGLSLASLLRAHRLDDAIDAVIFCNVAPALDRVFTAACQRYLGLTAVAVTHDLDLGIQILTDAPGAVGADRLVNAVAAAALYPNPAITIDMGTATKLDVVSDAALQGGVIAPGLRLAADALVERAAQLSDVPLTAPPATLGRNTTHAMQSGLIFGYVSMIEGLIQRLCAEIPDLKEPTILGAGGYIDLVAPYTTIIDHVTPNLTLSGLRVIYERLQTA